MKKHENTTASGRVLVTGAGGFVGSHVLQYLRKESCNVVGTSRTANIEGVRACNLVDHEQVDHLFQENGPFSSIVHIAGNARANGCNDFYECMKNNVAATAILAGSAAKHGVSRFIYCSTLSVNGLSDTTLFDDLSAANPKRVCNLKMVGRRNRCAISCVATTDLLDSPAFQHRRTRHEFHARDRSVYGFSGYAEGVANPRDGSHRRQWLDVRISVKLSSCALR